MAQKQASKKQESAPNLIFAVRTDHSFESVQKLRVALTTSDETFFNKFFNASGIQALVEVVNKITNVPKYDFCYYY